MTKLAIFFTMLLCLLVTVPCGADGPFVFSYFKDNGQDGLHLAWSSDGLAWKTLNNDKPLIAPVVGGKLMRDPSIVQGPDGTFHMVWSSSWKDLGFGYASSKDLIHWSEQRFIAVNAKIPGAQNTWAPDLFYDLPSKQFVVIYATTIPGRFPETDKGGDQNHRLYQIKTTDFSEFSAPTLTYDPGHNSIDGTLVAMNDNLKLIYKDERLGHKQLLVATASALDKPFTSIGKPILARDWVEGPSVLRVGKVWRLYFDCYAKGHYGAAESEDGETWFDITDKLTMPKGARHGTALVVTPEILDGLLKLVK